MFSPEGWKTPVVCSLSSVPCPDGWKNPSQKNSASSSLHTSWQRPGQPKVSQAPLSSSGKRLRAEWGGQEQASYKSSWQQPVLLIQEQGTSVPKSSLWKCPKLCNACGDWEKRGPIIVRKQPRRKVEVSSATLSLLLSSADMPVPSTTYQTNGRDRKRIQAVLESKVHCCKKACCQSVSFKALATICDYWHCLTETQQMQYLCAQHEVHDVEVDEAIGTARTRTDWFLCESKVCFSGLCSLLGVGEKTILKRLKHGVDLRKRWTSASWRPQVRVARNLVDFFFMELYHSQAEDLAETQHIEDVNNTISENGSFSNVSPEIFSWTPEAALTERIPHFMTPDPSTPRRHLPPGKPMTLFWQLRAWWEAIQEIAANNPQSAAMGKPQTTCPSWATFWRAWSEKWSSILTFRQRTQHKECDICYDYRENLQKKNATGAQKIQWAKEWQEHLRAQYHDRLIYWSLRWASRAYQNVLVLTIDSMDKAKTAYPQWRGHVQPGYLHSLIRPRTVLSAVLCHGWSTSVYLSPEEINHGADNWCELIARSLENVAEISRRTGRPMPQHLVIQADNTTAQCKNSLASVFLCYLVLKGKFLTATLNFLTVGHTHEDIDRFFALVLMTVLRKRAFEVPEDLVEQLQTSLQAWTEKRGEELSVQLVEAIRDFTSWLDPLGIKLEGAFMPRQGKPASHSFSYKVRTDLTPAEAAAWAAAPGNRRAPPHPEDVFGVLKGRMYMIKTKTPVLALPHCRLAFMINNLVPTTLLSRQPFTPREQENLQKLITIFRTMPNGYLRAAATIERLLQGAENFQIPPSPWLETEPPAREAVHLTQNQYYEHLPDTSWNLVSVFHRR